MDKLFGISMTSIMWVLLALFAACIAMVLSIWVTNRVMFRLGLRNVVRRRTHTGLVVVGLMLATLIITAAFATGDSLDYSITKIAYDNLQRTDLSLHHFRPTGGGESTAAVPESGYATETIIPALRRAFTDDPDIEGFIPLLFEVAPALNPRTKLIEPAAMLAGVDPASLDHFGGLRVVGGGRADLAALDEATVYVNRRAADRFEARRGDTITVYVRGTAHDFRVAGIVEDERASGALEFGTSISLPGIVLPLPVLQELVGRPGQISTINVVLFGDARSSMIRSDPAAARLEEFSREDQTKAAFGLEGIAFQVEKNKQDAVKGAEQAGNAFTTIFILMGLFSIAAGVLLIFMIFVMLAAERQTEMGIARAVGAKRAHLVEMFVSEGMVYDIIAGAAGAVLGVAAAFWLIVGGARVVIGEEFDFFAPHVSVRSLVVSYCLGVVLTFLTVVISSMRVSRLNIVAAMRGLDEGRRRREHRQRTHWRWVLAGVPALVIPPLGLYWLLRKGFRLPWAWIIGPVGIALGGALLAIGKVTAQSFPFTLGMSLLPFSAAALAGYYGAPSRITWTTVGLLLAIFWLAPTDLHDRLFGKLTGGMEMFVLSGIMIVAAFTLVIVFNARLLNALTERIGDTSAAYRVPLTLLGGALLAIAIAFVAGDRAGGLGQLFYLLAGLLVLAAALALAAVRVPSLAPALKMGVAYPLANRFRTGMTIAMFSLIVFSLIVMSIINASFLQLFAGDESTGGWDISVTTARTNPVPDVRVALAEEGSFDVSQIIAQGRMTRFDSDNHEVRQAGSDREWQKYSVRAGDGAFWSGNAAKFDGRAAGYDSDRAVFDAVGATPGLAVIDSFPMQSQQGFGAGGWHVSGVAIKDSVFEPFEVEFRDLSTGRTARVTVVGVFSAKIPTTMIVGVYTNEQTFRAVYGTPEYDDTLLRLAPGVDGDKAAKAIKAALVTRGVQASSIQKMVDDVLAQSRGIMRIFQVFMGLGLLVGIAALGVVAFRSVVERRQQIGMLRAIGYQRGTVALSFLLESSFIASMGILSGVVGAAILSYNLINSNYFTTTSGLTFYIPWTEVIAFAVIAYGSALLMTWWPSRRAARVPIAEALRYE